MNPYEEELRTITAVLQTGVKNKEFYNKLIERQKTLQKQLVKKDDKYEAIS